ncbi:MAG: hypothetical protein K2O09_09695, partial [Treponemataceae bacterium]|nr:hypothetical protein [Treponemataceae bacterium]
MNDKMPLPAQTQKQATNKNLLLPQHESKQRTKFFSFPSAKVSSKQKFVASPTQRQVTNKKQSEFLGQRPKPCWERVR